MIEYPSGLKNLILFFEGLSDLERRENLVAYAEQACEWAPKSDDHFVLEDVRRDQECTDTVGLFLNVDADNKVTFAVTLGPHVQTLTKALAAILCEGLRGCTPEEIIELPQDFVPRIVGGELVRVRSQTVYYVLGRMKGICKVYLQRKARDA